MQMTRSILCLWAASLAVALLFCLRSCASEGIVIRVVEVPTLHFIER